MCRRRQIPHKLNKAFRVFMFYVQFVRDLPAFHTNKIPKQAINPVIFLETALRIG